MYSEKATKFCEISTNTVHRKKIGGDFTKFFGLLRIYELYLLGFRNQVFFKDFTVDSGNIELGFVTNFVY